MRSLVGLLVLTSCVTAKPVPEPVKPVEPVVPAPRANAVRVRALPFDVSACAKPAPPSGLTNETLAAFLELERPRFEACLAPPTSREKADATADLEVTVAATASARVTPRNVTAEGVACLEARVKDLALTGTASTPLVNVLVVAPPVGAPDPSLELVPEVNALRAAVTSACSCFEPLGLNAPPQLVLTHLPDAPIDVVTSSDPLADTVERCLEAALQAQPRSALELTLDLPLLNGDATQESPDAAADVAKAQTAAMSRRHAAHVKLLVARHAANQKQLELVAASYKRKPTPKLARSRVSLCGELRTIEDELPAALERAKSPTLNGSARIVPTTLCASVKDVEVE
ncbi:MAG: hypothetical protein Q8L14_14560 [Myxococcales bacterium]|nr:hypothetical protein [Myxococcales bacterium]